MSTRLPANRRPSSMTDERMEQIIGTLLRAGVSLAAVVVLIGGIVYLSQHAMAYPQYRVFHGGPVELRHISGIVQWAFDLRGRGIIQLGLLLLIATPVARVLLSLLAFAFQRDRAYVAMTLLVLLILLYSLFGGTHL